MTLQFLLFYFVGIMCTGAAAGAALHMIIYPFCSSFSVFAMISYWHYRYKVPLQTSRFDLFIQSIALGMKFMKEGVPPIMRIGAIGEWRGVIKWRTNAP